jgi:hypothetical protein
MQHWIVPSFHPFTLGPFSSSASYHHSAWFLKGTAMPPIDVEMYNFVLFVCDILLTVVWHQLAKLFFNSPGFRIPFLSPSVRFSLGVLFGATRLWTLSFLQPMPYYRALSLASFAMGVILGLTALVFNDGPWRHMRPNSTSAFSRYSYFNPAHLALVTKQSLARATMRRSLEAGKSLSIVIDCEGELLYVQRGAMSMHVYGLFMWGSKTAITRLMCREIECRSGPKRFFGFWRQSTFSHFGRVVWNAKQKRYLLELLVYLNKVPAGERVGLGWFQIPDSIAVLLDKHE